ncbi:AAA family ATPase [Exiguobacterium mexicanum]|uniref:AAA family ATPase n=1 Tax=Exiguobacterium mexicanum TaxID=340146 RepID=UPI00384BC10C
MTIKLDLSLQEYRVFNLRPGFSDIEFKNKNFIFGKNGAGKSTLCKMIASQFAHNYDIHIFSGFDNVLEDKKLNAVVLGEENIAAKKEIDLIDTDLSKLLKNKKILESEIKSLRWNSSYIEEGIEKHHLYLKWEDSKELYTIQKDKIEEFYRAKAKELKEYRNPQITKTSYTKNDFMNDIKNGSVLDDVEKKKFEGILSDKSKGIMSNLIKVVEIDFPLLINEVNDILEHKVEQVTLVEELKDDHERKEFAEKGLKLHDAGESCAFCGNEVTDQRIKELRSFVSVSAIQEIEEKISRKIEAVKQLIEQVENIKELNKEKFYSSLHDDLESVNKDIKLRKKEYEYVLNKIIDSLVDKSRSYFRTFEKLSLEIPDDFSAIVNNINELINRNNEWTTDIDKNQETAMEKLRYHYVGLKIIEKKEYKDDWRGYEIENHEVFTLKEIFEQSQQDIADEEKKLTGSIENKEENTLFYIENEISKLEEEKVAILQHTKNTLKLVTSINAKLRHSGKTNFELDLVKDDNNVEHYQIKGVEGIRSIDKLSTGEKNIIGFLYFLECLSDPEKRSGKNKIIVFDDPMNSNDDTMQYLIITEIQKLYTNKDISKFDSNKDYFLCLTHNAHFYLNVQPQGNFKEKKKVGDKIVELSKYDKNHFYRLEGGEIKHITSQKDDFNTHYDFLWIELNALYNNGLLNSMLNSMRRIIETYTKFNKINPIVFYKDKEEHQKLFNVNSHSIDDHSMEVIGKNKEELLIMFRELFDSNSASEHFNTHWDVD